MQTRGREKRSLKFESKPAWPISFALCLSPPEGVLTKPCKAKHSAPATKHHAAAQRRSVNHEDHFYGALRTRD